MQPLNLARPEPPLTRKPAKPEKVKRDPAPSRWAYRVHRMWLTPIYRKLLRVGLPVFLVLTVTGWYFTNPTNRFAIAEQIAELRRSIETRPEFTVKLMAIEGATPVVESAIREMLPVDFPLSSFDLDLEEIQATVAALDVVEHVAVRVRPGGVLELAIAEREPVTIWRRAGRLDLIDATGHRVASITERGVRPDLPLIAGAGADGAVSEALDILDASAPIARRTRGLVRVGQRRWDIVLDRGQRIMLPEENPVSALEQVLALDHAQDLLARDITHIDMRNPARPTLRLAAPAVEELHMIRSRDRNEASQ